MINGDLLKAWAAGPFSLVVAAAGGSLLAA